MNDRTSFYNKQLEEQEKMFERRLREADERENALNLKLCELEALKEKCHNQQKIIDAFGRTEFTLKEDLEALRIQTQNREQELMRAHEERLKDQSERFSTTVTEMRKDYEQRLDDKDVSHNRKLQELQTEINNLTSHNSSLSGRPLRL